MLRGNFAPVFQEHHQAECVVQGKLPPDFPAGSYMRIGPNPRWVRPLSSYHWFDGDGMVHKVHLADGAASYSNRWVRTAKFLAEDKISFPLFGGMAAEKDLLMLTYHFLLNLVSKDVVQWLAGVPLNGNCNTNLVSYNGKLFALQELSMPYELDAKDLSTHSFVPLGAEGDWTNEFAPGNFTAHPHVCPSTGELVWASYRREGVPQLCYGVSSPEGEARHFAGITLPADAGNCVAHDMVITKEHSVLIASPLRFTPGEEISPDTPLVVFDKATPLYFGVVKRYGGDKDVVWIPAKPGMVFHFLNAYEEEGVLKVLGFRFSEFDLYPEDGSGAAFVRDLPRMVEWTLDVDAKTATERLISEDAMEFPAIHPSYLGRPQSVAFASTVAVDFQRQRGSPHFDGVARVELASGRVQKHQLPPGTFCGEFSFVPRPGGTAEDDGWLVGYSYSEKEAASELRILDARDLGAEPVARVSLPARVPYGFHGLWLAE